MRYHQRRQVFQTYQRAPRPAALLLREVRRMETLSFNDTLLAEQIDSAIRFHVMGFRAEQAYSAAHERDDMRMAALTWPSTRRYLRRGAI